MTVIPKPDPIHVVGYRKDKNGEWHFAHIRGWGGHCGGKLRLKRNVNGRHVWGCGRCFITLPSEEKSSDTPWPEWWVEGGKADWEIQRDERYAAFFTNKTKTPKTVKQEVKQEGCEGSCTTTLQARLEALEARVQQLEQERKGHLARR